MKNRTVTLDLIKIIACFLVIVNHTGTIQLSYGSTSVIQVAFYAFFMLLCKIAVPLFVMVTGSLLLNRQDSYRKVAQRIGKVLIPLIGLSLVVYVIRHPISQLVSFIPTFLQEPAIVPFWYLYMLIGLYLVSPFIAKMVSLMNELDEKIFLGLFLILPGTVLLSGALFGFTLVQDFFTAFLPVVLGYFVAGHYFSKTSLSLKARWWIGAAIILILAVTTFQMTQASLVGDTIDTTLTDIYFLNTILITLGIFTLIQNWAGLKASGDNLKKRIGQVGDLTFGIYLLHPFLVGTISRWSLMKAILTFNPILGVVVLQLFIFVLCALIIALIKKVPLIGHLV